MTKKCNVCKAGTISYSPLKTLTDAEGYEIKLREVSCSNKDCIINGMQVILKE